MSSENVFYKPLILLFFIIKIFKCDFEKSDKQLRYDACYKLVQAKAAQEQDHFKELAHELRQEEINNILQYSLFECYLNINYYDAEEIDTKNIKEIDIYQDNYVELLNFEKWEDLLRKKDENSIQYALMDIQKAYRDIQSGAIKINRYQKKPSQNQKRENMNNDFHNQREDDDDQYNFQSDLDSDFKLFGVNFSSLSPTFKNIIGFSLIIFIFACVIFGLKWIQKIREQSSSNKKKKNKKEKKKKN